MGWMSKHYITHLPRAPLCGANKGSHRFKRGCLTLVHSRFKSGNRKLNAKYLEVNLRFVNFFKICGRYIIS